MILTSGTLKPNLEPKLEICHNDLLNNVVFDKAIEIWKIYLVPIFDQIWFKTYQFKQNLV